MTVTLTDAPEQNIEALPASRKPTWEAYDDEFHWADEKDPILAAEVKAYMEGPRHEHTSSQNVEEYHRLHEENVGARKKFRFFQQDEFKKQREGRILSMSEFLRMLRQAGSMVWGADFSAWYNDRGAQPRTVGLNICHPGLLSECKHKAGEPHYVGFVQVPLMQEFEELYFDAHDVPLNSKRRGWRTVLLKIIHDGILTEEKAHAVFGAPEGAVSELYRAQLWAHRNLPREKNAASF